MKHNSLLMLFLTGILLSACVGATTKPEDYTTPSPAAVQQVSPGATQLITATMEQIEPEATATLPATEPPTPTAILPLTAPTQAILVTPAREALVIDHRSIELFDRIPEEYIQAAAGLRLLFRHASVGYNINEGLDCLMNKTQPRPYFCDAGIAPDQIVYDSKYNRSNWVFEFHAPPPGINPGWWDKLTLFVERVVNPQPGEEYDVYGFKFGYVDGIQGSAIDDEFFLTQPGGTYPNISALEELEARYPDKIFVYWTMGLARIVGTPDSQSFNQQMRQYALEHGKVLMDIADIESHTPDGDACFLSADMELEVICPDYTTEKEGGHLNALGSLRMAKAMWVLMARLAGWDGR